MSLSELDAFQRSLNEAIDAIRAEIRDQNLPELSIYASEPHPLDNPSFLSSSRLFEARKLALASIGQLKTLLQVPYEKLVEQSFAVYDTASIDIFIRTGTLDALAEPTCIDKGLHVLDLQRMLDLDPVKLTAILRYLAAQGWVYEPKEGIFALTRPALELSKGRNGRTWAMTPGKPKVAASLLNQIVHPQWKYSTSPSETAFQISHDTQATLFEYLKQNPDELKQWASSVRAHGDVYQHALLEDYPWAKLSAQTIVDCGGGQGFLSISLAKILKDCTFVVQDLPEVVPIAKANVEHEMPEAVKDGRLVVEPHSFFDPQPRKAANTVYVFRYILHNWTDPDCVTILRNAAAANQESKILIIEYVAAPSTPHFSNSRDDAATTLNDLVGECEHEPITSPPYIPCNFGATAKMSLGLGVHLMGVLNARERSLSEWQTIAEGAGLKISDVHAIRANVSVIECTAAP